MEEFTPAEVAAIKRALLSAEFQLLIGAEDWNLTEEEENHLWSAIKKFEKSE